MGTKSFAQYFQRGEPLIDVVATFHPHVDIHAAVTQINAQYDDFDFHHSPYLNSWSRLGTASQASLERIFGWRVSRFPREPGLDICYGWITDTEPDLCRSGLQHLIQSIGMSQPGADDDGQWWK